MTTASGSRRGSSRHRTAAIIGSAALTVGLLSSCTGDTRSPAQDAAQHFLNAVAKHDSATAASATTSPATTTTSLAGDVAALGTRSTGHFTISAVHTKGKHATADFAASWTVPGATERWTYDGHLALVRVHGTWRVSWSPGAVFAGVPAGGHLELRRTFPVRAALETHDGTALFTATDVVRIGIEPALVKNLPQLSRTLARIPQLQSSAAQLTAAVKAAAHPTDFVDVITLRRSVYDTIRNRIHDLDGTVFEQTKELLTPSVHYGQPLLGSVGPATQQLVDASKGRIVAGDDTGIGGLQQAYNAKLTGSPALSVLAVGPGDSTTKSLATVARARSGTAVRLTLDRSAQQAAERALSGIRQAATVVAVKRSTGEILADANSTATTYDLGLAASLPPGSTFKIATWAAAFVAKPQLTARSLVACPATTTVDGRHFENENKFSHPPIPISAAFGYSCNTSAINEAMTLPSTTLVDTAKRLGLGAKWSLPVAAFSGSIPAPLGQTERAADAIGQGRVLASPLEMALLAGAATSGTPLSPTLLAGARTMKGAALPASLTTRMNSLMRATVDLPGGTGHGLHDLRGVEGKTGTAEYGNDTPPRSHAWFAGVQGDVAFAIFVYDGASAKISPVDVAHTFLRGLPGN